MREELVTVSLAMRVRSGEAGRAMSWRKFTTYHDDNVKCTCWHWVSRISWTVRNLCVTDGTSWQDTAQTMRHLAVLTEWHGFARHIVGHCGNKLVPVWGLLNWHIRVGICGGGHSYTSTLHVSQQTYKATGSTSAPTSPGHLRGTQSSGQLTTTTWTLKKELDLPDHGWLLNAVTESIGDAAVDDGYKMMTTTVKPRLQRHNSTQLDVESSCVAINGALEIWHQIWQWFQPSSSVKELPSDLYDTDLSKHSTDSVNGQQET